MASISIFNNVKSFPKPVQQDGIPIHIGGHSLAAARRAGKYGDGFFPNVTSLNQLAEMFELVRESAKEAGRNPNQIKFSTMAAPKIETIQAMLDLGVKRVVFGPPSSDPAKLKRELERIANDLAHL